MPRYEGCKEAKEISLTRKGANQLAHVLIRKTAAAPAADGTSLENTTMPELNAADVQKAALTMAVAIAKMDDVTKTHFLGLADDVQPAFIAKTADEQKTEAHAAKADADRKAAEAEAIKSGKTVRELELEKRLDSQAMEIETLKAARADDQIAKRAASEFAGFPGGVEAVVPLLKAYAKLDTDARVASEAVLKAQCATANALTKAYGARTEEDVSKAAAAKQRLDAAAKSLAETAKISFDDAWVQVIEKREHAEDVAALS